MTIIEALSPSNKSPGDGQRLYLQKQRQCREAGTSFVEIDLLRGGDWVLSVPKHKVPATAYRVCVRRGWEFISAEV